MIRGTLTRLLAHVDHDALALTGGVAIELHAPGARDGVADLDFVARTPAAVRASITGDFLVSHHHLRPKWLLQLVDPVSRLRVDVFPDLVGSVARAQLHEVAGVRLLVLAREDILAHKLQTIAGPTDPKHVADVIRLGGVVPDGVVTHETVYSQDLDMHCARCDDSTLPLAPKRQIFEILGYV